MMIIIIFFSEGRIFIGFKSNSFTKALSFLGGPQRTDWPLNFQEGVIKLEVDASLKKEPIK